MSIPEQAIEAARKELAKGAYQIRPEELPYADAAERAVLAAAPIIAAQALREAANAWWQRMDVPDRFGPWKWLRARADKLEDKK